MRIWSMSATFGKLEHATLELRPGLNVIEAPNEWGKSTWCAFLTTMLYGLDTSQRSKKDQLADKERYQPWSGAPMAGRIDLQWQGRDITIQRGPKGRVPMGAFRAFETDTGLPVPGLDGNNCGQVLLGVERSVFVRSCLIRSSDMPVTQDEDLRTRLNALVTTGDEHSGAEALGQRLRELRNRCQYHRKGLLPEAQATLATLEEGLASRARLEDQAKELDRERQRLERSMEDLRKHSQALDYRAYLEDMAQVAAAEGAVAQAEGRLVTLEEACVGLPDRETAAQALRKQAAARQDWERQLRDLPPQPVAPSVPEVFRGISPEDAVRRAEADRASAGKDRRWLVGLLLALAGVGIAFWEWIPGLALLTLGLMLLAWAGIRHGKEKERRRGLLARYGHEDPEGWVALAKRYQQAWERYHEALARSDRARQALEDHRQVLTVPEEDHQAVLAAWDALAEGREALDRARAQLGALRSMARPPVEPVEDGLTLNRQETDLRMAALREELRQLQLRLGQVQGRLERFGDRQTMLRERDRAAERVRALEQTCQALDRALEALAQARAQLQRRFAPRLTRLATDYFARLTGGRYRRLTLGEDLSLQTAAEGEELLRDRLWRSEGTVDQLYLALRLAVAKELCPTAPLVLDDALIRFDQARMTAAMEVLTQEAEEKQVILFTCHGREGDCIP